MTSQVRLVYLFSILEVTYTAVQTSVSQNEVNMVHLSNKMREAQKKEIYNYHILYCYILIPFPSFLKDPFDYLAG